MAVEIFEVPGLKSNDGNQTWLEVLRVFGVDILNPNDKLTDIKHLNRIGSASSTPGKLVSRPEIGLTEITEVITTIKRCLSLDMQGIIEPLVRFDWESIGAYTKENDVVTDLFLGYSLLQKAGKILEPSRKILVHNSNYNDITNNKKRECNQTDVLVPCYPTIRLGGNLLEMSGTLLVTTKIFNDGSASEDSLTAIVTKRDQTDPIILRVNPSGETNSRTLHQAIPLGRRHALVALSFMKQFFSRDLEQLTWIDRTQ